MKLAHRVEPGEKVRLADIDPDDTGPFSGKSDPKVEKHLTDLQTRLSELQERLYAEQRRGVLVVLQAMDTAGKDGVLRKVVGPLDSRGVDVATFKAPNTEELAHDYLWRCHLRAPRRGDMVFFNRSHYEDVLAVRVLGLQPKSVWRKRFDHINDFERMLTDEGTRVVKIYLHISKDEQKKRLQERLDEPDKRWKSGLEGPRRARALGRLHGGLRGGDGEDQHGARALVGGAGESQVVPRRQRRQDPRRPPRGHGPGLPEGDDRPREGEDPRLSVTSSAPPAPSPPSR